MGPGIELKDEVLSSVAVDRAVPRLEESGKSRGIVTVRCGLARAHHVCYMNE